jgi:signal transduction histidine kinase/DNA-binding response OmpR family regulator
MTSTTLRLLIVEDRPDDAELLLAELKRAGYDPKWTLVESPENFVAGLAQHPDIIVCDYSLPLMTALDALRILRDLQVEVPLIVVSGVMDEDTCVNSLRLGAVDYLLKDRLVRLGPAIEHALAAHRLAALARTARRERRETADILRGVVDHAPAAICVRDATGNCLLTNAEYDRLAPSNQFPRPGGAVHAENSARGERRRLSSAEQACLDGADKVESEEVFTVDGQECTFLVVRYPVVDGTGRRFAVGAIYVDITRQKKVEEDLRELDRLKGEFVATVSHELRTPLTSISGYAELLLISATDPAQRKIVDVIDRNSRRLTTLVEDLLTLSRVDSGAGDDGLDGEVDLAELIGSATTILRPVIEASHVRVELEIAVPLPIIRGDRSQLERVLLNLLSNAVKFSDAGGTVTVHAESLGDELEFSVRDTGMGVPEHEQPMLFTRFFRSFEATRRAIQGTGLGLAVVREIVERHQGTIQVVSALGQGTTMTVSLPIKGVTAEE